MCDFKRLYGLFNSFPTTAFQFTTNEPQSYVLGGRNHPLHINSWDYMLTRNPDGSFRLWHHVTPADGGYGREVDIMLPADYFKRNSARDFYEQIAPMQMIPVSNYSKEEDIKALASALKAANLR